MNLENMNFISSYRIIATSSKEGDETTLTTSNNLKKNFKSSHTSVMTLYHCHCRLTLPTLTQSPGQALHQSQSSSQSHNTEIPVKNRNINNQQRNQNSLLNLKTKCCDSKCKVPWNSSKLRLLQQETIIKHKS